MRAERGRDALAAAGVAEQALLFLNRRGYAPVVMCHACGWVAGCRRCDARLTLHAGDGLLWCHHCGSQRPRDRQCPDCGSADLVDVGLGTERLEEQIAALFKGYEVVRVDRDSTRRKGALERSFEGIPTGRFPLLVGTQILAKGHHFPDVSMVVVLDADQGLHGADFRAPERMAQLILQVAGRAGRADKAEWNFRIRLLLPEKGYPGLLGLGLLEWTASQQAQPALAPDTRPVRTLGEETNGFRLQHAWVCPPSAFDGPSPRFLNDPVVRQTAQAALRSGAPSYCYHRELGTEIAGKPAMGLTIFVPFMEQRQDAALTNNLAPAAQRVAQLAEIRAQGVVFGSVEPNLLIGNLFGTAPREVGFDLFSGYPLSAKTWLNVSGSSPPTLTPDFRPYLRAKVPLQFHGQEWTMVIYTTPLFEQESSRYRPWTVIVGGTALSMLMGALLFVQIHSRVRQEAISGDLRSACEDLQQAQNERECISRDLHDGAIQSLYGLQLSLGHYDLLRALDAEGASKLFERCCQAVDALIAELRTFIVQGSRQEEADMSPNPAVTHQKLVRRFQNSSSIPIELVVDTGPTLTVPQVAQMHLRQIAQEAISNSLRHGRPRHIKVELVTDNGHLHLRVSDDGRGFNATQVHASGRGLANMQGRAVQLGGIEH